MIAGLISLSIWAIADGLYDDDTPANAMPGMRFQVLMPISFFTARQQRQNTPASAERQKRKKSIN